jgi:hypothetical protein
MTKTASTFALFTTIAFAAAAHAHNHITLDTASGAPGDRILIRAGYLPAESSYSIVDQRLMQNGAPAVYLISTTFTEPGPFQSWAAGDGLSLSSDFYFATGRLAGGDFRYELSAVSRVSGRETDLVPAFGWGTFSGSTGAFTAIADSRATDRAARSFASPAGSHQHGQGLTFIGGWVVDLTFVAWDASGTYTDSEPVIVRFDTGACKADISRSGGLNIDDIFIFINLWFAADPRGDFDSSGARTIDDIFIFLNAWFAGC